MDELTICRTDCFWLCEIGISSSGDIKHKTGDGIYKSENDNLYSIRTKITTNRILWFVGHLKPFA